MRHAPFRLSRELPQPIQPVKWGASEKDFGSSYSSLRSSLCSRSRSLKQPRDAMLSRTSGSSSPLEGRLRMATLRPGAGSRQGSGSCFPPLEWYRNAYLPSFMSYAQTTHPRMWRVWVPTFISSDSGGPGPSSSNSDSENPGSLLPLASTPSLSLALSSTVL